MGFLVLFPSNASTENLYSFPWAEPDRSCLWAGGIRHSGAAFGQEASGTLHSALPTNAVLGWLGRAAAARLQLVALGFCVTHWLILGSLLRFPGFSSSQTVHTPHSLQDLVMTFGFFLWEGAFHHSPELCQTAGHLHKGGLGKCLLIPEVFCCYFIHLNRFSIISSNKCT